MAQTGTTPRLTVFCHIHNEAFLLPFWIRHHLRIFDHGVIVDRGCTDESLQIIREIAPTWDIIPSRNLTFDAVDCDREMMDIEGCYDGWKIVLNATEFLFHDNLSEVVEMFEQSEPDTVALRILMVPMVDPPDLAAAPVDPSVDLWRQRYFGRIQSKNTGSYVRVLHRAHNGQYAIGRHSSKLPSRLVDDVLILRYSWSPYSAVRARKLSIQSATAATDIVRGMGFLHLCTPDQLDAQFAVESRATYDLREQEPYRSIYQRMLAKSDHQPRAQASTETLPPAPAETPRVVVVGESARCTRWVEALGAEAALTPADVPTEAAILIGPNLCLAPMFAGRTAPLIVDLSEPPEPSAMAALPFYAAFRDPASPTALSDVLAAADYVVFASEEMRELWVPHLIKAGRITESAGLEAMATVTDPNMPGAIEPVQTFLSDPVRRGVPVHRDRLITVSEASYRLTHNLMMRALDDYYRVYSALNDKAGEVAALQQQNLDLTQRIAELTTPAVDGDPTPVRRDGTRRLRFPSMRRSRA